MAQWVHECAGWPAEFRWEEGIVPPAMDALELSGAARLDLWAGGAVASSNIEDEFPDYETMRELVAAAAAGEPAYGDYAGIARMTAEANAGGALEAKTLCGWHRRMFPGYAAGMTVGAWRQGPVRICSMRNGAVTKVHYEAPAAGRVAGCMDALLDYCENSAVPLVIRAGVAHLWFEQIHPFDDGNGRIGRAIMDCLLARAGIVHAASEMIWQRQSEYYQLLEAQGRGEQLDLTEWLRWFLQAVADSQEVVRMRIARRKWRDGVEARLPEMTAPCKRVVRRMLREGWQGPMTLEKFQTVAKCSRDLAFGGMARLELSGLFERREGSDAGYDAVRLWLIGPDVGD